MLWAGVCILDQPYKVSVPCIQGGTAQTLHGVLDGKLHAAGDRRETECFYTFFRRLQGHLGHNDLSVCPTFLNTPVTGCIHW
jgi:hypothetical protein